MKILDCIQQNSRFTHNTAMINSYSHFSTPSNNLSQHTSVPGEDDITRHTLSNGITILSRPNLNSQSVVISGYIKAGGIFDPEDKLGLADFTVTSLMRGTRTHNFHEIYDNLESAGASFGYSGAIQSCGFSGKSLAEDLGLLLETLSDTLRYPTFPEKQVELLRSQLLTGLAIRSQSTGEMASLKFDAITYPGHPYSVPVDGYIETIQNISQKDLVDFHTRYFGPMGMVISIIGAVDPQHVIEQVNQALGDWQNPTQTTIPTIPPAPEIKESTTHFVEIPGKIQSDIIMGVAGPPRSDPNFLAASIGNNILGQFGMMGRIGDVVREQAGLAYYAYSSVSGGNGPGPWIARAGVNPTNVEKAVELIKQEISRFIVDPVSPEELNDSKANYIGRLPLALESNAGVASALLNLERYNLGLNYYREYPQLINAISDTQILEIAQKYLDPNKMVISVAGSENKTDDLVQ